MATRPRRLRILYVNRDVIPQLNNSMTGWCGLKNPQDYDNTVQEYKPTAKRFEEGSHNLLAINALGTSIRLLLAEGSDSICHKISKLTQQLIDGAKSKGYKVITPVQWENRAGIVSIVKDDQDVNAVAKNLLDEHNIVIAARRGFLRISPHFYNTEDEIARLLELLP